MNSSYWNIIFSNNKKYTKCKTNNLMQIKGIYLCAKEQTIDTNLFKYT